MIVDTECSVALKNNQKCEPNPAPAVMRSEVGRKFVGAWSALVAVLSIIRPSSAQKPTKIRPKVAGDSREVSNYLINFELSYRLSMLLHLMKITRHYAFQLWTTITILRLGESL
ncbi:hypothetical protein B9Z55_013538 [Caenorhabditis nigoni]|uniref:Uncharacterized protein n=1 Tax=Caenorhabditis nigoni TaxID=1611254 RepID=A0A2G5U254_9PELO|nr:hypothetical protein B9Z55_013538 [Caenorhabditis nigoni]